MQNAFSATNIKQFRIIQEQEARQAVREMLRTPQKWEPLTNKFATAVILRVGFGVGVEEDDHPYLKMAEEANTATTNGILTENFIHLKVIDIQLQVARQLALS